MATATTTPHDDQSTIRQGQLGTLDRDVETRQTFFAPMPGQLLPLSGRTHDCSSVGGVAVAVAVKDHDNDHGSAYAYDYVDLRAR
jgi:hypothetical protein